MITLKITEAHKKSAMEFAKEIIETGNQYNRFKQSDEIQKKRTYIGKVGELVFYHYLQSLGVEVDEGDMLKTYKGENKVDKYDFITPRGETIDIKTASESFHKRIMIQMEQFNSIKKDYYIGIKLDFQNNIATIYGYTTKEILESCEIENFGEGNCKAVFLTELQDIRFITDMFQRSDLSF